jgi:iron complex outermembrane receptor protein
MRTVLEGSGTIAAAAILLAGTLGAVRAQTVEELRSLSLEQLSDLEVTSVSRRPEPISKAPASVYVITNEDIRRSGAVSLPEVLRLAPNLEVAEVNAHDYAISARGFDTFESANKLLVLIDGRSVYSPLHSGVFWDEQQVMLEDIDRIEVISGPGGPLWGANAVNGVINIITKAAAQTQGGLIAPYVGTKDSGVSARYGGALGDLGAWRAYALGFKRGETTAPDGHGAGDDWDGHQAGFRTDLNAAGNAFTLQGDIYDNPLENDSTVSGGDVLGRWRRQLSERSAVEVQAYYDAVDHDSPGVEDYSHTYDVQAQHNLALGDRHQLVWGGGYRVIDEKFKNTLNGFTLANPQDTIDLGNVFGQDTIALRDDLNLTLGVKVEYSSYTDFEYLPNVRLAWQVSDRTLLWSAISRAVRTPSRIDRELEAPGILSPASDFKSEKLIAYEAGYRGRPTDDTSLSVSLYYNDYDDLRALAVSPDTGLLTFDNVLKGQIYGLEAWGEWQVTDWWRLSPGVNLLHKDLHLTDGGVEVAFDQHRGNDPNYELQLRSQMDLWRGLELDLRVRAVDDRPDPSVPAYVAVDARLGWHVTDEIEVYLAGFNLTGDHAETGAGPVRNEIPTSVILGGRWRF